MFDKIWKFSCILTVIWFIVSYIEIIILNTHPSPHYHEWNLIVLLFTK